VDKEQQAQWMAHRAAMIELLHHPSWDTYGRDLESEEARGINRLVACTKDEHDYWQGYVTALRWCYHRPTQVIQQAEKAAKENNSTHG
jgi:hypothetical protein